MSWKSLGLGSSSAQKINVVSKLEEDKFQQNLKKLDDLEETTRRLYKDGKRLSEANAALASTEHKITHELLKTTLCQSEDSFQAQMEVWDAALTKMEKHMTDQKEDVRRTVLEPLKKFVNIFPNAQMAVKNREKSLQDFQKCQDRVNKVQERERTGPNVVKLAESQKALTVAQENFSSQDEALREDIPQMIAIRTDYFQPSLEALIKSQVKYTKEAVMVYGELSNAMNGHKEKNPNHDYNSRIQQALKEVKALSITAD